MKKYLNILKNTKLFSGCDEEEILSMTGCLNATVSSYKKGEYILRAGTKTECIKLLLEGNLLIQKDDYWGNRTIIDFVSVGEMLGEAFVGRNSGVLPIDVIAVQDSTVISFDFMKMLSTCSNTCRFHSLVIENLFFAISEKNRKLMEKISHITGRTTRDKLISYLSAQAKKNSSSSFTIPFNRQQLADYLGVDRSAMSNELSKMREDGLIIFNKNNFTLLLKQ